MTNANDLIHSFMHGSATEGNFKGLTKLEYFAAIFHAALLGRGQLGYSNEEGNAIQAVKEAKALITELNKQQ